MLKTKEFDAIRKLPEEDRPEALAKAYKDKARKAHKSRIQNIKDRLKELRSLRAQAELVGDKDRAKQIQIEIWSLQHKRNELQGKNTLKGLALKYRNLKSLKLRLEDLERLRSLPSRKAYVERLNAELEDISAKLQSQEITSSVEP